MSAKILIRIPHVAWRNGRPRFVPAKSLRVLGYKGEDLRDPATREWMTVEAAAAWAAAKTAEIAGHREAVAKARAGGKRIPKAAAGRSAAVTVEALFEQWFATPRMKGEVSSDGKRRRKAAAAATIRDYAQKREVLAAFDPDIYGAPAASLSRVIVFDLYERLWESRGLATARGTIAVLSAALTWGMNRGLVRLAVNPCLRLGMEMPEARVRAGTPEEVRALVIWADLLGRPEIGDAIVLGVWTGQRQKDRLAMRDVGLVDGRRLFRQAKTGAIVEIRESPELAARLAAARARRADWRVQPLELVVDERTRQPFKPDHYRHLFAGIRDAAAFFTPSLADVRDQDLRDTAVTWLARAGCTPIEIAQITGHSLASVQTVLKHYLSAHREIGDNAIRKAVAWYEGARG